MLLPLVKHLLHDYHPPTDGLLEVVIKSHGPLLNRHVSLLRCVVSENLRSWDSVLSTTEFAYNSSVNRITGMNPFEIVISYRSRAPIDLIFMSASHRPSEFTSFASNIHTLH